MSHEPAPEIGAGGAAFAGTADYYQRALLDNFPFMVWLKDTQSRFLAVNKSFADTAGVDSPDTLRGKTDLDVFPADLAQGYRRRPRGDAQSPQA